MDLQEQDIAMLEAYLAGGLSGDALHTCEARLAAEPALAETLAVLREMEQATAQTARAGLKQELIAAKAAAVAAGMENYSPSINAPKSGGSFFGKLLKFLITLGILGGSAWLIWKYVLHEQWPPQFGQSTTVKTETKTTIQRDTIRREEMHHGVPQPVSD
jgi:hypothetical protein